LHLGLVDAARQDAAPALGRGASGLHVLKAFEEHSQEAGEPRHLVIAPDGTLFAAAARGGKYQQGLVFRIKADGSAYQVLYDFLGNRQDGSDPSSLMLGPEGADIDLIVLGTHGRTGIRHLLLGSVAERVVRSAKVPVITVPSHE